MFHIPGNLVLENKKVQLRLLNASDYELLLPFALNEPGLWQFSLIKAAGRKGMKQYLDIAVKDWEKGYTFPFIVYDKPTGSYAGSTRFYDIQPDQRSLLLGYTWYGKAIQGTGLNKNCKYLLLEYAFEILVFDRVEFRADAQNSRSIAAMKSLGCTVEGILRDHLVHADGGRRSSIILSVLRNEWYTTVKPGLLKQIKNLL